MTESPKKKLENSFQKSHQRLLSFVRTQIPAGESDDLVQEVYLQALSNLNILESVDNLTGWLFTVARNKVIDWYRRRKVQTVSLTEPMDTGLTLQEVLAAEIPATWNTQTREMVWETILECVEELPEKQRFVFIANALEGRTFRELALETGESINTLLARKRYAIRFLRGKLTKLKEYLNEL